MKGTIETFVGIIIIAFMAVLSTCYITASMNTRAAQNYHAAIVTEIEASHFSDAVISQCKQKAKENGYAKNDEDLVITKMPDMNVAEVKLNYHYTIPFLNLLLEHEIVGYAR